MHASTVREPLLSLMDEHCMCVCWLLHLQGGSVRLLSDVGLSTLCSTLLGKPLGEHGSWQAGLTDGISL
jgi:hypothetical protein